MNSPIKDLSQILDFLLDLMPPSHITLVGAGNGKGRWAQWLCALNVPSTLVEADEQQFVAMQHVQTAGGFAQARLLHTVVAAEAGNVDFHTSSLTSESGLLSAEALQQVWPNVHTLQAHQRHATALTELLDQHQHAQQWLVLDCLPAAALLKAAAQLDVLVARVLLTENSADQIPGASLAELAGLLPEFTQVALQPTRHPAIGHALFVRNARTALLRQVELHQQEHLLWEKKHSSITKLVQDLQVQIDRLNRENATMDKQAQEQAKKIDQLSKELDEQSKLAKDRQIEIGQLTQAKTVAEKKIQEHDSNLILNQEGKEKVFEKIWKSLFLSLAKSAYTERFLENSKKKEIDEKFSADFFEFEGKNISYTSFLYSGIDFFFVHAKNDYIPRVMAEQASFYETPFLETLASLYKPGSTIVDCGANIGNHSVFFAKVLGADVISFEPQPFNHLILKANILLNNCQSNFLLIEKGAGEKKDILSLHMAVEDNYGSFTTEKKFVKTKSNDPSILKTFNISIEKMDDEIGFLKKEISIIKIDVEGMELSVLKGARQIIKNNLPAIAAECFTKSMFNEVKKFLSEFGYFPFDSKNATPTFIFLCKNNEFHNKIVCDFFENSSLNKYENKKSFVEK